MNVNILSKHIIAKLEQVENIQLVANDLRVIARPEADSNMVKEEEDDDA